MTYFLLIGCCLIPWIIIKRLDIVITVNIMYTRASKNHVHNSYKVSILFFDC
ncbi:hypothetical protein KL86DYS2_11628 [uncultured Dysgonomonas sp.]|uniref:Uncharacterized protein n=1 Tax=uncultured Dysgonomonas sp. TaxID=206096 RepID=A0A212JIR7_9BACT|nr:hypothetical protein KL86DYS2_11628 [uncultured Dysgonomonas sp.]